jgi:hypothetical protein
MFQHFLRYVRNENWFLFLKHLRHRANARNCGTDFYRGRVCFSIEVKYMQTLSVTAEDPQVDSVKAATVGQNVAHAVQGSFYRRLLDHRRGRVEQCLVSLIGRD